MSGQYTPFDSEGQIGLPEGINQRETSIRKITRKSNAQQERHDCDRRSVRTVQRSIQILSAASRPSDVGSEGMVLCASLPRCSRSGEASGLKYTFNDPLTPSHPATTKW